MKQKPATSSNRAAGRKVRIAPKKKKGAASDSDAPAMLGAHVSIAGGVDQAIHRAIAVGCTAMQIFVKNNMQWFASAPIKPTELDAYRAHAGKLAFVMGHSGYMINLAAVNPDFLEKSRRALRDELERANQLGLPFLVLHPGAHMGAGVEQGLKRVVESIDIVLSAIPEITTRIALETTAGQGTCLGAEFEHLAFILRESGHRRRLCVCADTAHLFAAGYDISTEDDTRRVFEQFDRTVGLGRLAGIHLNDSKTALGSRVDRHEHIGKGRIGLPAFRWIMRSAELRSLPKVLETPKGKEMQEDVENLAILRGLAGN